MSILSPARSAGRHPFCAGLKFGSLLTNRRVNAFATRLNMCKNCREQRRAEKECEMVAWKSLLPNPVFLNLVLERPQAYTEQFGGFLAMISDFRKSPPDDFFLDFF